MKLIGYLRVSTDRQGDGFGIDVQRELIGTWAKANGHRVVRWCEDVGVSGSVEALDRPGLTCVLDSLTDGDAQGVVISDLDRLGRRLMISEAALGLLRKVGGRVFTVNNGEIDDEDDDETRILIRQVLGAIAEFEARKIVKRLQAGRAAKASSGGYAYGAPAYGQRCEGGELVVDDQEQAVVGRIESMRADGASYRTIAAVLNDEAIPTKRGGRWHPATVQRIIDDDARERNRLTARRFNATR